MKLSSFLSIRSASFHNHWLQGCSTVLPRQGATAIFVQRDEHGAQICGRVSPKARKCLGALRHLRLLLHLLLGFGFLRLILFFEGLEAF